MSASISNHAELTDAPMRWNTLPSLRPVARARLLLADDHELLLEAFRRLLEPEFDIVRAVNDGEALVEAALSLRPDAVLCDITMPKLSGLQALRQVRERIPGMHFIILTMHDDPDLAAEALQAGALAYVLKSSPLWTLTLAIRTALSGKEYFCPLPSRRREDSSREVVTQENDQSVISPRGREVLRLLAGGRTMKETAARLGITPRTVAFHKYRMMQQLSLRSSAELVQFAVRGKIV